MRDKKGVQMLAVWRAYAIGGWPFYVAAKTRKEAAETMGMVDIVAASLVRVKGAYATGKPREL